VQGAVNVFEYVQSFAVQSFAVQLFSVQLISSMHCKALPKRSLTQRVHHLTSPTSHTLPSTTRSIPPKQRRADGRRVYDLQLPSHPRDVQLGLLWQRRLKRGKLVCLLLLLERWGGSSSSARVFLGPTPHAQRRASRNTDGRPPHPLFRPNAPRHLLPPNHANSKPCNCTSACCFHYGGGG
jgi:hypothetical protein